MATNNKYPPDSIPIITERLVTSSSSPQLTPNINNERCVRRKFSFPASFHSNTLLADSGNSNNSSPVSARRRLSNVSLVISDAVTRKLSTTIGWRGSAVPTQEIVTQGKCLCGQYIRCRLKRAGLFTRKLGLQRIRSIIGTPSVHVVREVFPALLALGEELEALYPRLYTGVSRQVSRKPGGELTTPETALIIINAISRELFKTDITWGKIISLFAITGGLSVDCVKQGHPEYLSKLVEGVADVIEDDLSHWINDNGGWVGLSNRVRPPNAEYTLVQWTLFGFLGICCLFLVVFAMKYIGMKYFFPNLINVVT